jgi:HEPN domain-containing protein
MIVTKPPDPHRWQEAERWLAFADDDMRVAELAASSGLVPAAAFHCQQSVEKMAKAVLVALGEPYPKIHDIAELARLIEVHRPEIGSEIGRFAGLTDWYVTGRYPAGEFFPSSRDVIEAMGRVRSLRQRIAALAPKAR